MSRHIGIAIVTLALISTKAAAQVNPVAGEGQPPLTLRAAVAEAVERNPELVMLRRDYEAARAAPAREGFLAPPMFETQIWGWPVTALNPVRTDMYMFMAEQELPGRGKRAARVLVGERDAEMSRQHIAVRANTILSELKQAFVDLALAREMTRLYGRQVPVLQDMAEATTLRYASGRGTQHHTVTTLVELTRLQRERIAVDERIQTVEARLNTLLGRPPAQPIGPVTPMLSTVAVADAEQVALERHPEIALADAAVAREEAELARVGAERRPDFVIGGGYMLTPGAAGAWTARAGISWPNAPWSRGRLTAAIDLQAKRVDAARARREAVAAGIRRVVRDAVIRLTAAERQAHLIESTVLPQVEHAFDLARLGYTGGEGSFSDALDAQRLSLAVQLELAEARANIARARADLDTAVGTYE